MTYLKRVPSPKTAQPGTTNRLPQTRWVFLLFPRMFHSFSTNFRVSTPGSRSSNKARLSARRRRIKTPGASPRRGGLSQKVSGDVPIYASYDRLHIHCHMCKCITLNYTWSYNYLRDSMCVCKYIVGVYNIYIYIYIYTYIYIYIEKTIEKMKNWKKYEAVPGKSTVVIFGIFAGFGWGIFRIKWEFHTKDVFSSS